VKSRRELSAEPGRHEFRDKTNGKPRPKGWVKLEILGMGPSDSGFEIRKPKRGRKQAHT